jgi:Fe2+ transport system protein B
MGFFSDLWETIKNFWKKVYNFFSKIFSVVFQGIKFIVECIIQTVVTLQNSWVGKLFQGISFIFELIDFLQSKGADIDADGYKQELLDMNLNDYGVHQYNIVLS